MIESAYIKTKELIKTHKPSLLKLPSNCLTRKLFLKKIWKGLLEARPFEKEEYQPMSQHKKIFANGAPPAEKPTNGATNGAEAVKKAPLIVMEEKEATPEDVKQPDTPEEKKKEEPGKENKATETPVEPASPTTLFE